MLDGAMLCPLVLLFLMVLDREKCSPLYFLTYMNELSVRLNSAPIGCYFAGIVINHVMYANDLVVFAPSAKGLQTLLNLCLTVGKANDISFNRSKSKLRFFDTLKCW